MAREDVQGVMQALHQAQSRRMQQFLADRELQQHQAQNEFEKQRIGLEQEKFKHQSALEDASAKAAEAVRQQQKVFDAAKIAAGLKAGQPVPGAQQLGSRTTPAGETFNTFQLPDAFGEPGKPSTIELPSEETSAKQAAGLERITSAPKEEAKTREIEAGKQADFLRSQMMKAYDDQRAAENKAAEDLRNKATRESAERIAVGNNRATVEAARLRAAAGGANALPSIDITPYVNDALTGNLSRDEILKMQNKAFNKQDAQSIIEAVIKSGARVLTDKQKSTISDFQPVVDVLPKLKQYNEVLKANPIQGRIPLSDAYKTLTRLDGEIEMAMPNVARILEGEKGKLSNQQIQYSKGGFVPSRSPAGTDVKQNDLLIHDFEDMVHKQFDAKMGGLPEGQKALIKQKLRLLDNGQQATPQQIPQAPQVLHWQRDQSGKLVQIPEGQ